MSIILKLESVSKKLNKKYVLKEVSLALNELENLAIIGETGSSKTTLLKSIGGLLEVDSGKVLFQGEEVKGPSRRLVPGHPQIKYLAQRFELPKFITVDDYLDRPSEIKVENPEEIYEACNVSHLLERDTSELSGGERQRVALAKEILKAPSILLLDEPFSNLDFNHRQALHAVLKVIKKDLKVTTVLVAHDPRDVLAWADAILVMKNGEVVQSGSPGNIYNDPFNDYVAGLLGVYSRILVKDFNLGDSLSGVDSVIIRPHHVNLGIANGEKGTITAIHYFGSYDQVTILHRDQHLVTLSEVGTYKVGDEVIFQINL